MERQFIVFSRFLAGKPYTIQSGVVQPDERGRLAWAGTASLPYAPQGEGLPADGELARIGKIEDQLIHALNRGAAVFVGHVNGANHSRVIFYSPAEGPKSLQVKTGLLKKEDVSIEWRHDPDWSLYKLELQPTPEEVMVDRFRDLLYKLFQLGDNPDLPRQVDFTFIFKTADARSAFLTEADRTGYASKGSSPEEDGRFWCEVHKTTSILPDALIPHCVTLDEMSARNGGEFDGWACHVTK